MRGQYHSSQILASNHLFEKTRYVLGVDINVPSVFERVLYLNTGEKAVSSPPSHYLDDESRALTHDKTTVFKK